MNIKIVVIALLALFFLPKQLKSQITSPVTEGSVEEFLQSRPMYNMLSLAIKLASLPPEKVKHQKKLESKEGDVGFETEFESAGTRYTCRLYKSHNSGQNRFRVSYGPVGQPDVGAVTDFNVDGFMNQGVSIGKPNKYAVLQSTKEEKKWYPDIKDVQVPKGELDTDVARNESLKYWEAEYQDAISEIRALVFTAQFVKPIGIAESRVEYKRDGAGRPIEILSGSERIQVIYDPVGQAVVTLTSNRAGRLEMEEKWFDAARRLIKRRTRVLIP